MGMLKRVGRARKERRSVFEDEALPHLDALYQYARHLTRHSRDAEDLVQDTMVKAYRFIHRYTPGTNCKAWLFRIMTNLFLKKARRNVREFSYIENVDVGEDGDGYSLMERSSFYRDPERELLGHMVNSEVKRALEELPADFRTVVLLADLQDFTYKEIADVMDCPVGTVMSRLYRARKALQRRLFSYALEEGYIQGPPKPRRRKRVASEEQVVEETLAAGDAGGGHDETRSAAATGPTSLAEYRERHRRTS